MWPFAAKCPIDDESRAWVDSRMAWLAGEFGMESWWRCDAVEPNDHFFPDLLDGSEQSVRLLLDRVCGYMGVDPLRITLRIFDEDGNRGSGSGVLVQWGGSRAAGTYARGEGETVSIAASKQKDMMALVATMAHELAHARLIGEERTSPEEEDHEPTTDLTTVFFGMGIFNANSAMQFNQWSNGQMSGWRSSTLGYLDERTFGYALGLWAYVRCETIPDWAKHLRLNLRAAVKQTLRFLEQNPNPFSEKRAPLR